MLYFLIDKKDCTACTACMNVCPVNCISMIQDEEGFEYPVANDNCIHCSKCEQVCPVYNKKTEGIIEMDQYAAAAITKNYEIWKSSTSGGAFTEICNVWGNDETIIFGARFNGLKVIHDYVVGPKNIHVFRKSKYVQSSLSNNFIKVKEFLEQGKQVIFSGTPCQIAGLKSFLNNEYRNLLCIDLICHGVGSPTVFQSVIELYEKKYESKIIEYSFRNRKKYLGNLKIYVSSHKLENNKINYVHKDIYNELFLNQLCLRPSCGINCRFRTSNRQGDITIADFKNKKNVFPKLKDYRNYSSIVINSKRGDIVFKKLHNNMDILPCTLDDIKENNPLFYKHTNSNPLRDDFFKDYIEGQAIDLLIKKYLVKIKPNIFHKIYDLMPYCFKIYYRNIKNKFSLIVKPYQRNKT